MLYSINRNLQYINREGQEEACGTLTNYLEKYKKKVTLLDYFKNYMNEHLLKAGGPRGTAVEANEISRLPYLRTWFRTRRAIVLHLSNGILQVNHPPLPKDHFRKYKMLVVSETTVRHKIHGDSSTISPPYSVRRHHHNYHHHHHHSPII